MCLRAMAPRPWLFEERLSQKRQVDGVVEHELVECCAPCLRLDPGYHITIVTLRLNGLEHLDVQRRLPHELTNW